MKQQKSRRHGFTLVEILAVISIIIAVSAISIGSYQYIRVRNTEIVTEAIIQRLRSALEAFKGEFGYYPSAPRGSMFFVPYTAEIAEGADGAINDDAIPLYGGLFVSPSNKARSSSKEDKYYYGDYYSREATFFIKHADIDDLYTHCMLRSCTTSWSTENSHDDDSSQNAANLAKLRSNNYWRGGMAVCDAWGNPLFYACPGRVNPDSYDLFSSGYDGVISTGKCYPGDMYHPQPAVIWWSCAGSYSNLNANGESTANEEGSGVYYPYFIANFSKNATLYFSREIGDDIGTF